MIKRPKPDRPIGKRVKPKKTDKEKKLFAKYRHLLDVNFIPPEIVKAYLKDVATLNHYK